MSWTLPSLSGVSLKEAHRQLDNTVLPQPIREYVKLGLAGIAVRYGDEVNVSISGHGHVCDGPGSYDVTSATIQIAPTKA